MSTCYKKKTKDANKSRTIGETWFGENLIYEWFKVCGIKFRFVQTMAERWAPKAWSRALFCLLWPFLNRSEGTFHVVNIQCTQFAIIHSFSSRASDNVSRHARSRHWGCWGWVPSGFWETEDCPQWPLGDWGSSLARAIPWVMAFLLVTIKQSVYTK